MNNSVKLFHNGTVYTSFKPKKTAEALVTVDNKILYQGNKSEAVKLANMLEAEKIDLQGNTLLPGFIDSHMHLTSLGRALNSLNLRGVESIEALKEKLEKYVEKNEQKWILGRSWDQDRFKEDRWPTRWDLDEVVKEKPVMLTRVCGHVAVLNTKAMKMVGLLDVENPQVLQNDEGKTIGVITEAMVNRARQKVQETLTITDYQTFLKDGMQHAASHGVTTVTIMGAGAKNLKALLSLPQEAFTSRVRVYLSPSKGDSQSETSYPNTNVLDWLEELGIHGQVGNSMVKIIGIKVLGDGSLGGRTAWLSEPYADEPTTRGFPTITSGKLRTIVEKTKQLGLQLSVHGIGDATIDMILNNVEAETMDQPPRIEHASIIREDQIKRMARLGFTAGIQPHFVISDFWTLERIGEKRGHTAYPFKTMQAEGIPLGLGTDAPVEKIDPWNTVYAAITRGKYEDTPLYEQSKDETLTMKNTLHHYTKGSADIIGAAKLGTLKPGNYADLIIVDKDPFKINEQKITNIAIEATYVGGKQVA